MEALEKSVKYAQSWRRFDVFITRIMSTLFSNLSFVDFEHAFVCLLCTIFLVVYVVINYIYKLIQWRIKKPGELLWWNFRQKKVDDWKLLTIFTKKLHHRCLTGLQIRLCYITPQPNYFWNYTCLFTLGKTIQVFSVMHVDITLVSVAFSNFFL